MRSIFSICIVLGLVLLTCTAAFAQVTGDYRSNGTGNWNDINLWQVYNGSSWVAASTYPTGTGVITLQGTDSLFLNVDITIKDTLKCTGGKVGSSTTSLTFDSGSVYLHEIDAGKIPPATWNTGSTVRITGSTSAGPSFPSDIPVYNVDVDLHGMTANLQLNMTNTSLTIRGHLWVGATVGPSGITSQLRLSGSSQTFPSLFRTYHIGGDVILDSARSVFTTCGSSTANTGDSVYIGGDVKINAGEFSLNRGSGASAYIFCYGNFSIAAGARMTRHSSSVNPAYIFFRKGGQQNFTNSGTITTGYYKPIEMIVDSGSIFNTGASQVTGGVNFTLKAGTTLETGRDGGVDSAIACSNGSGTTVTKRFEPGTNFIFDGSVGQVTGTLMPDSLNNLTINNASGVTLTKNCTVQGTLDLASGILSTSANTLQANNVTRGTGYVRGILQKEFAASGSKVFEVGTANGYSPMTANVTAGTGLLSVSATQGAHPHVASSLQTLARYWTLTASGITQADLTFQYLLADVNGSESLYQAGYYNGTAFVTVPTVVDTLNHTAIVTGASTFGDWSVGEAAALDVKGVTSGSIPKFFYVNQNYPNPFNPTTMVEFGLPKSSFVTARVYNLLGQQVATLFEGEKTAGVHALSFDASRLGSGIYFCRIQAGTFTEIKRMVLMK